MKKEAPPRKTIHPPCWIEPVVKNARVSEHNRCLHSINKRRKRFQISIIPVYPLKRVK